MKAGPPIKSKVLAIGELFADERFGLASYQREYTWSRSEVRALLTDLHRQFSAQWRANDDHTTVESYAPYFLGTIVYYKQDGVRRLVDGQQRLTTLHLLLIYLNRLLDEQGLKDLAPTLHHLVYRPRSRTFTVHIAERTDVLKAILDGRRPVLAGDQPVSVRNIVRRYADIEEEFPQDLRYDDILENFVHWLLWRVCVIGIEAESKTRGWEIFETTNNRGIRLGPLDLVKSHLVGQAAKKSQESLSNRWRALMSSLEGVEAQAPSQFMKDLIVAKYLTDLGDGPREDATSAVHEWVRENEAVLGLQKAGGHQSLLTTVILPLGDRYLKLRHAAARYDPLHPWAAVTYVNQHNGIPFHLAAVLAALRPDDDDHAFHEKARLVGGFLDLLYVRRLVNRRAMRVEGLTRDILNLLLRLRDCTDGAAVQELLQAETAGLQTFSGVTRFGLTPESRGQVRYILARLTAFLQSGVGKPDELVSYLDKGQYDIEHIVPDSLEKFQRHDPKADAKDFAVARGRLGALLLLPKSDNSSIGDASYPDRIEFYRRQHLFAASLHPATRQGNPTLRKFLQENKLDKLLQPIPETFGRAAIDTRQELCKRLCELVWDPARLGLGGGGPGQMPPATVLPAVPAPRRALVSTPNTETLRRMVAAGRLSPDDDIVGDVDGIHYHLRVLPDGCVQLLDEDDLFPDLSAAGNAVRGKATSGWEFWKVQRNGRWVAVGRLRSRSAPR
jgi:hypothetical protein